MTNSGESHRDHKYKGQSHVPISKGKKMASQSTFRRNNNENGEPPRVVKVKGQTTIKVDERVKAEFTTANEGNRGGKDNKKENNISKQMK